MKTYQSKWGFHPVSRESSKKLRFLNSVYAKSQHLAAAWERWENKQPHNRVMKRAVKDSSGMKIGTEIVKDENSNPVIQKEPEICSLFHEKIPAKQLSWGGYLAARTKDNGFGLTILYASRLARTPQPTADAVKPIEFTEEEIDRLYQIAQDWMKSR